MLTVGVACLDNFSRLSYVFTCTLSLGDGSRETGQYRAKLCPKPTSYIFLSEKKTTTNNQTQPKLSGFFGQSVKKMFISRLDLADFLQ